MAEEVIKRGRLPRPIAYMAYMQWPEPDWKRPRLDVKYAHFKSRKAAEDQLSKWILQQIDGWEGLLEEKCGKQSVHELIKDPYGWWCENHEKASDILREADEGTYVDNEYTFRVVEIFRPTI
jgi:hypothetical protein